MHLFGIHAIAMLPTYGKMRNSRILKFRNRNGCRLDVVYDELVTGLKAGLKEVSCGQQKNGQVRFTKELATMRKELHCSESKWLQSKAGDDRKQMRSKYLEMR